MLVHTPKKGVREREKKRAKREPGFLKRVYVAVLVLILGEKNPPLMWDWQEREPCTWPARRADTTDVSVQQKGEKDETL
jgi:hypothetical protein